MFVRVFGEVVVSVSEGFLMGVRRMMKRVSFQNDNCLRVVLLLSLLSGDVSTMKSLGE